MGGLLLEVVRDFEPDGDADAIIAKAGAGFDAVIVSSEDQGRAFLRTSREEHVLHEGAARGRARQRLADIGGAQFRRVAERADFLEQPGARLVERSGIDGVGRAIQHTAEAVERALRVELLGRVGDAHRDRA